MVVVAVVGQNNSYDAWENYANLAYVAVALDTENLYYYLDENVAVPDPMMAYRMDYGAVVHRYGSPCHHYRVDRMADYRTKMMMVAIVGLVNVVMIYCCQCGVENFHRHLIHLNFQLNKKLLARI